MYITEEQIAWAVSVGACAEAVQWLRAEQRTIVEAVERYASWLLLYAADRLTPEQLDECAKQDPRTALEYAARQLTPERLDACAKQKPWAALGCAADRLTPEQLDACAEKEPWYALQYAAALLTPERLDACAVKAPRAALRYVAVRRRLTPERLAFCESAVCR